MKELIDIHVVLATPEDMEVWEEEADQAAEKLNAILHLVYDRVEEDIDVVKLEYIFQYIWENWRDDSYLLEIDDEDLQDWVDHLLATWDDAGYQDDFDLNE